MPGSAATAGIDPRLVHPNLVDDDHRRRRVGRARQSGRAGRGGARVDALGHLAEQALAARAGIGRDVRREDERRRARGRAERRGEHAVVRDAAAVVVVDVLDDGAAARIRAVEPVEELGLAEAPRVQVRREQLGRRRVLARGLAHGFTGDGRRRLRLGAETRARTHSKSHTNAPPASTGSIASTGAR